VNLLLIPDGFRRYALSHGIQYADNYLAGARKMLADLQPLSRRFETIGAFPLAKYNLERQPEIVDAMLGSLYVGLSEYKSICMKDILVIGDTDALFARWPPFAELFLDWNVNPHLEGNLRAPRDTLVLFLCYDGRQYVRQIMSRYRDGELREHVRWHAAFRTGCEGSLFRYSEVIFGTEQTRVACSSRTYQEIAPEEIVLTFANLAECPTTTE